MDIPIGVIRMDDTPWLFQNKKPRPIYRKETTITEDLAATLAQGGYWEKGNFRVSIHATKAQVYEQARYYKAKFEETMEGKGFKVHQITDPRLDYSSLPIPPDQKRYVMYALVSRRPKEVKFDIPDMFVPALQEIGLKLVE